MKTQPFAALLMCMLLTQSAHAQKWPTPKEIPCNNLQNQSYDSWQRCMESFREKNKLTEDELYSNFPWTTDNSKPNWGSPNPYAASKQLNRDQQALKELIKQAVREVLIESKIQQAKESIKTNPSQYYASGEIVSIKEPKAREAHWNEYDNHYKKNKQEVKDKRPGWDEQWHEADRVHCLDSGLCPAIPKN